MPRYTDIDNLIKIIQDQIIDTNPNDLGYKVLTQFITALNHAPIADVVPKSEVDEMLIGKANSLAAKFILEDQEARSKALMAEHDKELAREILDELEEVLCGEYFTERFWFDLGKLRIKYIEGQK